MNFRYLNFDALDALDAHTFSLQSPFPWSNPQGVLTKKGFNELIHSMPPLELFSASFGIPRNYGQQPHDRYELYYEKGCPLSNSWTVFIAELESPEYRDFIERYFNFGTDFLIRFQWHYAENGCSVSPHVDSYKKLGSHLFYFNTNEDWQNAWGGHTVVLFDSNTKHKRDSAPSYNDFDKKIYSDILNNKSFLFKNEENAWHSVEPICAPEGAQRRMFAVVFDIPEVQSSVTKVIKKVVQKSLKTVVTVFDKKTTI